MGTYPRSCLPAYFQHAMGCTSQNPRLKPGAIKFDAFSILVLDIRVPKQHTRRLRVLIRPNGRAHPPEEAQFRMSEQDAESTEFKIGHVLEVISNVGTRCWKHRI